MKTEIFFVYILHTFSNLFERPIDHTNILLIFCRKVHIKINESY